MKRLMIRLHLALVVGVSLGLVAAVSAHEVTYRGTVVSMDAQRYARPDGGFREVREISITVLGSRNDQVFQTVPTITARDSGKEAPQ